MELLLDLPSEKIEIKGEVREDSIIQLRTLHYLDDYFDITAVNGSDENNVSKESSITIGQ